MLVTEWEARFRTGCPDVDSQHHALIRLINALGPLMENRCPASHYRDLLSDIATLAEQHCQSEERQLERASYPYLAQHQEEHKHLVANTHALVAAAGDKTLTFETLQAGLDAWLRHMVTTDLAAKAFFNA